MIWCIRSKWNQGLSRKAYAFAVVIFAVAAAGLYAVIAGNAVTTTFVNDTFTVASNTVLSSHTPETGGAWTRHPNYTGTTETDDATTGSVRPTASGTSGNYYNATSPTSANYIVSGDITRLGSDSGWALLEARMSTTASTWYDCEMNSDRWAIKKQVAGVGTSLANTTPGTATSGHATFTVDGTSLTCVTPNGTLTATDSSITAAGKTGILLRDNTAPSSTSGYFVDNFQVTDVADTTPPDTSITAKPSNPTTSTSASFSFTGTDNVGVSSFDCQLDGGGFSACASPKTYSGLALGSHTFDVRALDAAGNVDPSPASYAWTINEQSASASLAYPRLEMTHYGITSMADAVRLARWDLIVTDGEDPTQIATYWPTIRSTNPDAKITPIISGTENNNRQSVTTPCISPQQLNDSGLDAAHQWTESWWLRNANGSIASWNNSGRHIVNPTSFTPANGAGERWSDHIAAWVARCYRDGIGADGVLFDLTNDGNNYTQWPNWDVTVKAGTSTDIDRDGIADTSEHGAAWVNQNYGTGMEAVVSKTRTAVGSDFIVMSNSGNGIGFAADENGQSFELGNGPSNGVIPSDEILLFQQWEASHFGTGYATMNSQSGSSGESNYKFMRHNLVSAMVAGAYFSNGCGAPCNYNTLPWYDEYSVNGQTPTGDASSKGYCGQPTGVGTFNSTTKVWTREFDNCLVLVNNNSSSQTVSLGGTFKRINGTQDHAVNNGATGVTSQTLAANDGIVLLK